MTTIVLETQGGTAQITLETAIPLKVIGAALIAGGPVLASFQSGGWWLGDARLHRITCNGCVLLEFTDGNTTGALGPFAQLTFQGEVVLAGDTVLARFDSYHEHWQLDAIQADSVAISDAWSQKTA